MGSFILFKNTKEKDLKKALSIFERKKLVLNSHVQFLNYKLITFEKRSFKNQNLFTFNNSDFVASTGISVYKDMIGIKAAQKLYQDIKENTEGLDFSDFKGHYCFIVKLNDRIIIFNDYNGSYHVYHDIENNIFSNSFLAVSESLSNKELSPQELYEYIFHESTYGGKTILKNISQMNSRFIYQLNPTELKFEKRYTICDEPRYSNFDNSVKFTVKKINNYFKSVLNNFDSVSLGLSARI